jgi:hypothetical protein
LSELSPFGYGTGGTHVGSGTTGSSIGMSEVSFFIAIGVMGSVEFPLEAVSFVGTTTGVTGLTGFGFTSSLSLTYQSCFGPGAPSPTISAPKLRTLFANPIWFES